MTSPLVTVDAIRQSEWMAAAGLKESAAYELLRISGIKGELRRSPGTGRPVRFLLEHQIAALEPLVERYRDGMSLRQIEEWFKASGDSQSFPEVAQASTIVPEHPQGSALVSEPPGGSAILPKASGASPAWASELITAIRSTAPQAPTPDVDPLKTARRLEEAARLEVPLSQSEVAMLLGLSLDTIQGWAEDREVRPGFWLRRMNDGRRVWWSVRKESGGLAKLPEAPGGSTKVRAIGFADVIAAAAQEQEVTLMVRGPILPVIC